LPRQAIGARRTPAQLLERAAHRCQRFRQRRVRQRPQADAMPPPPSLPATNGSDGVTAMPRCASACPAPLVPLPRHPQPGAQRQRVRGRDMRASVRARSPGAPAPPAAARAAGRPRCVLHPQRGDFAAGWCATARSRARDAATGCRRPAAPPVAYPQPRHARLGSWLRRAQIGQQLAERRQFLLQQRL